MIKRSKQVLSRVAEFVGHRRVSDGSSGAPAEQELNIYWTPQMAQQLETWGADNAWREIQFLLVNCRGTVLDIACGTGTVIEILAKYPALKVSGCDISDFLLAKAVERGIDQSRLQVCDATSMPYPDGAFDYSYSIGSLEHFPEDGIGAFLKEARRITRGASFHQIPTARSRSEGWISPSQSYFNNGVDWWLPKFRAAFDDVTILPSTWSDRRSVGRWFICR